jgi:hypothetical protein
MVGFQFLVFVSEEVELSEKAVDGDPVMQLA